MQQLEKDAKGGALVTLVFEMGSLNETVGYSFLFLPFFSFYQIQ